jgi:hypothetical protein
LAFSAEDHSVTRGVSRRAASRQREASSDDEGACARGTYDAPPQPYAAETATRVVNNTLFLPGTSIAFRITSCEDGRLADLVPGRQTL